MDRIATLERMIERREHPLFAGLFALWKEIYLLPNGLDVSGRARRCEWLRRARRLVAGYVQHYNNVRLNSAIGYVTPKDILAGRHTEIHAERDRKVEEARKQRQDRRQKAA
jgi:hypothetical protein